MRSGSLLLLGALLLAGVTGCGASSDLAKVSGVVTYKGQPVEGAVVAFHCNTASVPATGTTDASGRFTLTTLTPGDGAVPTDAPPYDDANPNPPTEQFFGRSIN